MKINKKRSFRIMKRIAIIVVLFLVVLVASAFFLGKAYEDKIEQIVVKEVNKSLNSEVSVRDIEFSLLKEFPFATLLFYDVLAKDATNNPEKETLLQSELISLHFNIIDIFRGNYILKHIVLNDAQLILKVDKNGGDNYHFLKNSEESEGSSFSLSLNKLAMNNVSITYKNDLSDQDYSVFANKAVLKGKFSEINYSLKVNGDFWINNIISDGAVYLKDQESSIEMDLNVDQNQNIYLIDKGKITLDDLTFKVNGKIENNEAANSVDIDFVGSYLNLSSVIKKLPDRYKIHFNQFESKGRFFLAVNIKGELHDGINPHVNAEFNFEQGKIIHKKTSVALNDVQFTGIYTNGKNRKAQSSSIQINNFSARLNKGVINGNLELSNFLKPEIVLITDSDLDLGDLQEFLEIDAIKTISGTVDLKVAYKGKLNSFDNFTPKDLLTSTTSGKMSVKNMNYQLEGDNKEYENISAEISFNNNDLIVDNLEAKVDGSDFQLKGYFKNFLNYLFVPDESLLIEAAMVSRNIELDQLLTSNSSNKEEEYRFNFADKLEFNLDFNIEKLNFEKFEANTISGNLKIKDRKLNLSYLNMQSQDGSTQAKGNIDGTKKNKLLISCDAFIKDVNVSKLFYEFGSFGQSGLTEKNINGTITANIKFSGKWNSYLKVDPASVYTKADLIIANGSLVNYPPLMGLSEHLKDADLSKVSFSTLQNEIEIKDEQIFIPGMEIESDAIDIFGSGTHKFNNEIDYHLRVLWSELKTKKEKNESEFGVVIDDGLNKPYLFFVITGTLDDPIVKYDKKGLKSKIASDMKKEGKNLKQMFKEEFNIRKNEEERIKEKEIIKKQEEGKFVIEWDEEETDTIVEKPQIKKKEKPQVYIEWDDEDDSDTLKNK